MTKTLRTDNDQPIPKLFKHKCLRCMHVWFGRIFKPVLCPHCHSNLWNKEYVQRKVKVEN